MRKDIIINSTPHEVRVAILEDAEPVELIVERADARRIVGNLYKGKVTFWGEIDRQYALPFGTPEEVRQAVARVRHALDDGAGGVIAQCEWGKDNAKENIETVFQSWSEPVPGTSYSTSHGDPIR